MYILLQKAKLGRELQVEVKVPEELYGYRIHKLLLQPFVENAIRHGLKQKEGELKLGITMRSAGGQMHIIVKSYRGLMTAKMKQMKKILESTWESST